MILPFYSIGDPLQTAEKSGDIEIWIARIYLAAVKGDVDAVKCAMHPDIGDMDVDWEADIRAEGNIGHLGKLVANALGVRGGYSRWIITNLVVDVDCVTTDTVTAKATYHSYDEGEITTKGEIVKEEYDYVDEITLRKKDGKWYFRRLIDNGDALFRVR